jgi:hypothetical protein
MAERREHSRWHPPRREFVPPVTHGTENIMADEPHKGYLHEGDRVEWNTSPGKTRGRVEKKLTSETHIKGHKVAASKGKSGSCGTLRSTAHKM